MAALLGFAACSSDNELAEQTNPKADNSVIIKASVGEGSIFTRSNPTSMDSEEQKKFNAGDEISVSDGKQSVNYKLGADGTTWSAINSGEALTWHSSPVTFNAFYPVSNGKKGEENNTLNKGIIRLDQNDITAIQKSDYMTANTTLSKEPGNHTLNLEFERQTARIVVNIVGFNNQWGDSHPTITGVNINGYNVVPYSSDQSIDFISAYTATDQKQYIALVAPSPADDTKQFINIYYPNGDNGFNHLFVTGVPATEAGKSYTYNLTLGKDKVTVENVTVEDWATGEIIPGGEAEKSTSTDVTGKTPEELASWLNSSIGTEKGVDIVLSGAWNQNYFPVLKTFLTNAGADADLTLDLSNVTGLREIPSNALSNAAGLTTVKLPSVEVSIRTSAFANSGLKKLVYDPSVKVNFGSNAFQNTKIGEDTNGVLRLTRRAYCGLDSYNDGPFNGTTINTLIFPADFHADYYSAWKGMIGGMDYLETIIIEADRTSIPYFNSNTANPRLRTIDLSNCSQVPTFNNNENFIGSKVDKSKITILVKNEELKEAFEADPNWSSYGFKEFKVKE